jgi:hypothetical protein
LRIPLTGQSYTARNPAVSCQRTLNLIVEAIEDPNEAEKGKAVMYGAPGRTALKDLTTIDAAAHPVRGFFSGGGRLFVAAGTKFMELDSSYNLVGSVHTIADDATHSPVTIIPNGNQLLILSAGIVYCDNGVAPVAVSIGTLSGYATVNPLDHTQLLWEDDAGGSDQFDIGMVGQAITYNGVGYTVQSVTNPTILTLTSAAPLTSHKAYSATPLFTATSIAFQGQYYIASRPQSRQINFSAFLDGSTWSGADFAIKESHPDNLRGIFSHDGQLFLLGTETSEAWQQVATSNVPFARIDGAEASYGLASPYAVVSMGGKMYFLGGGNEGKPIAYRVDGFTPVRISTHAEEANWESEGPFDAVISYAYQEEGHYFWVLCFGDRAWVWDATSKTWTERQEWDGVNPPSYYKTQYHTFVQNDSSSTNNWVNGKHITGGPNNGVIYESSINTYDNNGTNMGWLRQLPYEFNSGNRQYFGRMNLETATGMILSGPAPVITREYSDDRGNTWVNPQTASLGTSGQYGLRVFWPQGGSSYNRVWQFSGYGKSQVALIALDVDVTEGVV